MFICASFRSKISSFQFRFHRVWNLSWSTETPFLWMFYEAENKGWMRLWNKIYLAFVNSSHTNHYVSVHLLLYWFIFIKNSIKVFWPFYFLCYIYSIYKDYLKSSIDNSSYDIIRRDNLSKKGKVISSYG